MEHSFNPETDNLEALQKQLEAQQRQAGTLAATSGARVEHAGKVQHHVQISTGPDGKAVYTSTGRQQQTAYATPGLRPGHVIIGGVETTIDAAVAAGLLTKEQAAAGSFNQPVQQSAKAGTGEQGDAKGGSEDNKQPVTEAEQAAKDAGTTLDKLDQSIGADAVTTMLDTAADTGDFDFDSLPDGVSQMDAIRVAGGYIASAQAAFKSVGASIALIDETLTDDEARECRKATVAGDTAKLRHFGGVAVERLAQLPVADPDRFADMVDGMSAAERKCISQNDKGEWVITVPGRAPMSYGAAVRAGIVRV